MTDAIIDYEVEDGIGTLTLSRPPVNAMRYEDLGALDDIFSELPHGEERAVVFETAGEKTFMAGHDVNEFLDYDLEEEPAHTETYLSLLDTVYEFPLPIIAAVDGPAVGAGCILPSLCDIRVASPDAHFAVTEINVGVIGGLGPMKRVFPDGIARRMAYTGDSVSAERAYEVGMVEELADDPTAAAQAIAADIAAKSPDAVRAAKESAIEGQPEWPVEEYAQEREYNAKLRAGENAEEAAAAFLENREPEFEY